MIRDQLFLCERENTDLRLEVARLRAEVEQLRSLIGDLNAERVGLRAERDKWKAERDKWKHVHDVYVLNRPKPAVAALLPELGVIRRVMKE
jgi:predicted nuclease with TOPRIM domain